MTGEHEDSAFVRHCACENCGSSDANAEYSDGHTFCHVCKAVVRSDGAKVQVVEKKKAGLLEIAEIKALPPRALTEETCAKFGYGLSTYRFKGKEDREVVQVANYYNKDGQLVAQKVRGKGKQFAATGDMKNAMPFGYHCFQKTGKILVVTEGEIDAMSVSQAQGNKWPVVSIGCGADREFDDEGKPINGAGKKIRKYFAEHLEYFRGFEQVVLMFDDDEQGKFSARMAAEVLGPSLARIASLPLHDANDMLVAGRISEITNAIFRAERYKPDGIVNAKDLKQSVIKPVEMGLAYPFPSITKETFGIRPGQIILVGSGTGMGKTAFMMELQHFVLCVLLLKTCIFSFEQRPEEVTLRLAGIHKSKRFNIPGGDYTRDDIESGVDGLGDMAFIYDSKSANDWPSVRAKIEYLFHAEGIWIFFIDNLTAMGLAGERDEKEELEFIMKEMEELTKMGITLFVVSHLATPKDGKPHEEGGRVTINNFYGSRRIGHYAHFVIGLERDQQNPDPAIQNTTVLRFLKDRFTGNATGKCLYFGFNKETGRVFEASNPFEGKEKTPKDFGFKKRGGAEETDATGDNEAF